MSDQLNYSSSLNRATFLMFELKQIIKLKLEAILTEGEANSIVNENSRLV